MLPEAFAADPDRLARFYAEPARTYDIDVFVVLAGTAPAWLVSLERFYQ